VITRWQICWGDVVDVVDASDEAEAWCVFCAKRGREEVLRHPNRFQRSISRLDGPLSAAVSADASEVDLLPLQPSVDEFLGLSEF
jgi:hypothetical protein